VGKRVLISDARGDVAIGIERAKSGRFLIPQADAYRMALYALAVFWPNAA